MPKEKVKFVKYGKQGKKDAKSGDKWISMEGSKSKDMNKKKAERKEKKGKGFVAKKMGDSPAKMKKQGYNARLDDSLGAKNGKKSQSMKARRDESEGMEKSMGKRKFSGNKSSGQGSPAKMSGKAYDNKEAYNKDLSASARLHYLENERHDDKSPARYKKSPMNMSDDLSYGGPVIDKEPGALSHMGAHKVLKHMRSKM